jgi:deoxyribodipyrimidine photo-lyase
MIGGDYSTKFAPWLAMGCLSPRFVASECRRYEEERVANKSTYWVVLEMLIRDFFKFFALKHGTKLFSQGGTMGSTQTWTYNAHSVQAWKDGMTGYPLVDANMRELAASGFMSNRGRQNVASFLALDMHTDWRYGADYFEETLLDYDVHSNWVNWCNAAGMTGGRVNRFNIVKQSKDYDQHGDYVRHWLPELKDVPEAFVHEPWKMSLLEQSEFNCRLGVDYPNPIVAPSEPMPRGDQKKKGGRKATVDKKGDETNTNRGKGQRHDMKSLKTGQFRIG